jgi:putrescine transport system substrate-binding protein
MQIRLQNVTLYLDFDPKGRSELQENKHKKGMASFVPKTGFILGGLGILALIAGLLIRQPEKETSSLHVYNWYGLIPARILHQFEEETGIHLKYDLYDSNEILEAKLLAGKSGYDIVIPSASPYIARQIRAGVFQKLDKNRLDNIHHLDPEIASYMEEVDPGLAYSIPFYWGTIGFAYVEEKILERMPNAPVTSYQMLFNPQVVGKFRSCGVTLLDEAIDVYPAVLSYLNENSLDGTISNLNIAQHRLMQVRPFIVRFSGQRFVNEMLAGETCLAQAWSGDAQIAAQQARQTRQKVTIRYVIPEEGGTLWIDALCIPGDAPHPDNAYRFINFLMRPEISAEIANETYHAIANKTAKSLMRPDVRNNEMIYPPASAMKRLKLDKIHNYEYEEKRTRYWLLVKQGSKSF